MTCAHEPVWSLFMDKSCSYATCLDCHQMVARWEVGRAPGWRRGVDEAWAYFQMSPGRRAPS